jgi:hypothetical protein
MMFRSIFAVVWLMSASAALALDFDQDALRPQEGACGQLFKLQLGVRDGAPPYTFKIESGQLPGGLALSNDGAITGTPTDTGDWRCKVSVTDSAGASAQGELAVSINLPPVPQPLSEDTPDAKWHKLGWNLTFHDEFDGQTVDREKWSFRFKTIPSLCVLQDGIGHLRFEKDFPPTSPGGSGRISGLESRRTIKPLAQQYGYFELRARCHKGPGGQCAFWLSPVDGRYMRVKGEGNGTRGSGNEANEIDIFEQQGNDPTGNNFTVHYGDGLGQGSSARHVTFPFDLTADFHVYALEWDAESVTWYVDGKQVHRTDKSPHNPFFIRLGIYEADSPWSGKIDPKDPYPKNFDLDYIRVYSKGKP